MIDCLRQWRDPEPFFRGMLVESGFALETVAYDRPPRAAGESKNRLGPLIDFSTPPFREAGGVCFAYLSSSLPSCSAPR